MKSMTRTLYALLLATAWAVAGCSTPEAKVENYNKRGQALLQKGDLAKARLEFLNALQINPSAVPPMYGLGVIAERNRDWIAAYQTFMKVVELDPAHLDAQVKVGKLQVASGQLDKALETSATALTLNAEHPDVLGLRAAVFLKLNDHAAAVASATKALAKDPHHVDALVVLATERMEAADVEGAVAFLDKGLEANERNIALQMIKVQALEKLDKPARTEPVLRKLVTLFPDSSDYRYLLANFYVKHKQLDKAEAEHRSLIASQPKATAPMIELVRFLATTKGIDVAAVELERFVKTQPKSHELKLALATLRLQQKDDQAAVALWKEVIAEAGDKGPAVRARGAFASYHIARKDGTAAKQLINEMLEKDGRDEEALLLRAGIAANEGRLDDAIVDLRSVLRDVPESPRAQLMLARAHELQGLRDLATQHYANAARMGRFAPEFAVPYAQHLMKTGRPRAVESVLRESLRVSPGHLPALRLLAQSYLKTGNIAAAQAMADEAAKSEASARVAAEIQGAVQLARRDFGGSIATYKRAFEQAPADPQAMYSLVRSYVLANKSREAISFLNSVLAASPQNQAARVLLSQLLANDGNLNAAREVLQAAIVNDPKSPVPYQALVNVLMTAREVDQARSVAERGLQAVPADFGLRLSRAFMLQQQGKPDEAIAAYEALVADRPNAEIPANNLAALLADHRKDPASLRRAYDIAHRFRGADNPHLKDTAGWTAHLAGKHVEASELLKSASTAAPDLAVVHYHYGMNQLALNNTKAAKEALQRSIELAKTSPFPQVDEARRTLERL